MRKLLSVPSAIVFCLGFLGLFVPRAQATEINFGCSGGAPSCTGSVYYDGTNFKTSGIGVTNTQGPVPDQGSAFNLVFDTGAGTVSLTEVGDDISVLSGSIIGVTVSPGIQTTVTLHVNWAGLPGDFASFLGTPTGANSTAITFETNTSSDGASSMNPVTAAVSGVTVGILPTPEPMSFALLGSGLIMVGGVLRRRFGSKPEDE